MAKEKILNEATAERAVQELEDRFFDNSIDMLCMLDFNGYFKQLNPAWERTLGFTREELMSRPFIEFVHPGRSRANAEAEREGQGRQASARFREPLPLQGWLVSLVRWNPSPDSGEKVIYSVARDVTESRKAEEEREQLVRQLRAALAEVKTLREILPICSYCRKIREDGNYWHHVEDYISQHTTTMFSHGICPSCLETHPELEFEHSKREKAKP